MRNFIFLLLLSFSLIAQAEWSFLTDTPDGGSLYFDKASIKRVGNRVKIWELDNLKVPVSASRGFYSSRKNLYEYDCHEDTGRLITSVGYSNEMGMGDVIYSYTYTAEEEQPRNIVPDSLGSIALKNACRSLNKR